MKFACETHTVNTALHNPNMLEAYLNISCKVLFLNYRWSAGKKQKVGDFTWDE